MQIPQIRKPLRGLHNREMDIQIPVRLLRLSDHTRQLLNRFIDLIVLFPIEKIAGSLEPFRNVRIPEQVVRHQPDVRLIAVGFVPFQLEGVVPTRLFQDVELIQQRIRIHDLPPSTDEAWRRE